MQTNVKDRYRAWRADPQTSVEPTLAAAFAEGWTQTTEFVRVAQGENPSLALRSKASVSSAEITAGWDEPSPAE